MAAYSIKVLVSGYQSIDMHCIVSPVKFDGGLSISVLRNKQPLKKMTVKSSHYQKHKPKKKRSPVRKLLMPFNKERHMNAERHYIIRHLR
jgi:hypothetical protein